MIVPATENSDGSMSARKRRYAQAILCLLPVLLWLLQNAWFPVGIRIVLAALLILGLIRWTAALILLLIQFHLYLDLPTSVPNDEFEVAIVLLTIFSLMVISRLRSSQELSGVETATHLIRSAVNTTAWFSEAKNSEQDEEDTGTITEIVWLAARSVILVAAAGMILQSTPNHENAVREYGLTAHGLQAVQLGLLLFCGWMIIALPTRELQWKIMTPAQAGIWLRSQTVGWLHRDMRAIERRRRRQRSKQQRRQLHEMPAIPTDPSQKVE